MSDFPWGGAITDTLNLFLDEDKRLGNESTGETVLSALEGLSAEVRELVLSANLQPEPAQTCTIAPVGGETVVGNLTPVTVEEAAQDLYKAMLTPQFLVVTTMVTLTLAAAVFMVSTLSVNQSFDWSGLFEAFSKVFSLQAE